MFKKLLVSLVTLICVAQAPTVSLTTRAGAGAPLTYNQMDGNFTATDTGINAADRQWGWNKASTTGLVFAYYGGAAWDGTKVVPVGNGTTTLPANSTSYVERTAAGVVSSNTSQFTTSSYPMAKVVTGASSITSVTDLRLPYSAAGIGSSAVASFNGRTGAISPVGGDYAVAQITGAAATADLADTTNPAKGGALIGFKQAGTGAVAQTLRSKALQVVNAKDFGASPSASKSANATALQAAIAAVDAAGGGTVIVDRDINYGYKRAYTDGTGTWDGQASVWPDFSACLHDVEVVDASVGNSYGVEFSSGSVTCTVAVSGSPGSGTVTYTRSSGSWITDGLAVGYKVTFHGFANATNNGTKTITALTATGLTALLQASPSTEVLETPAVSGIVAAHDGAQVRRWQFTHDAVAGNTDANNSWIRGDWAPALIISNDGLLNKAGRTRLSTDNRRAGIFLQNDGATTWGIGQGTNTSISLNDDQLSTFTIKANGLSKTSPPSSAGGFTNVFELSKEDGSWAFNGSPGTYAGYFGARPGITPTFVFDGETAIDINSDYAVATGSDVGDGSGDGVTVGDLLTVRNAHTGSTTFQVGQTVIMSGLGEGVTIGSLGTGTGDVGTYHLIKNAAPISLALGSRTAVAGLTVIPGEPTITLFNGYSTDSNPYSKVILKNLGTPGFGLRLDGEFHGMVQSFFNVSDSTHQLVLGSLTAAGAGTLAGSTNFYATGDRATTSTGGGTTGGTLDKLRVFNSKNTQSLNFTFKDSPEFDIGVSGMGGAIHFTDNTASTSTSTGTIIVGSTGGIGVGGDVFARSYGLGGTGGAGFYELRPQTSAPSTPASNYLRAYGDSTGRLSWVRSDGYTRTFDSTLTANRIWTWQDAAGTVALNSNHLGFFSATTSAQLAGVLSDETGSGSAVFGTSPTLSGVALSDSITATAIAAPSTPASGKGVVYVDSTSKNLAVKDDAGVVKHGVQTNTGTSHQFATAISDAGVVTTAQPAFTDISGAVAAAQLPNPTSSTLGGVESLAATSHQWINTISTSGVPSSTQPAAADLSDGVTGSGAVVLATSPSLTTPTLGVATATSVNKVAITAPATSATLALADGSGLATTGAFTTTLKAPATASYTMNGGSGSQLNSTLFSGITSVTISNAGPSTIFGTGSAGSSLTVPTTFMSTPGATITVEAEGTYSSGSASPTLTLAFKLGSTTLVTMTTAALSNSISTKPFKIRATYTVRVPGASATGAAHVEYQGASTSSTINAFGADDTTATPNTTVNQTLDLQGTTAAGTGTTTIILTQQHVYLSGV